MEKQRPGPQRENSVMSNVKSASGEQNPLSLQIKTLEDKLEDAQVSTENALSAVEELTRVAKEKELEFEKKHKALIAQHEAESLALNAKIAQLQSAVSIHQTTAEQLDTTNEELYLTAEELETTNEELRLMTDQLEAANNRLGQLNVALENKVQSRTADLNQANVSLSESLAHRQIAFEHAPVGNIVLDEQGVIVSFNPAAQKIFGFSAEEIIGGNIKRLISEPFVSAHETIPQRHLAPPFTEAMSAGHEVRGLHKNGAELALQISIGKVQIGGKISFIATIADLSNIKVLEKQLLQSQKMEAVGQLTGGIAHDFNNLMAIIVGNLELLRTAKTPNDQNKLISNAKKAVQRGAALTERLLSFSRQQPLSPVVIDANVFINSNTLLIEKALKENIDLEIRACKEAVPIQIDTNLFTNCLLNLSINARDAMPEGGSLTITTTRHSPSDALPVPDVCIQIADTGHGIDKEILNRVTEPFFTTKKLGEGSGLGLSMVRGFIDQSNGRMKIESKQGVGTTISLYLPLTAEKEIQPSEETPTDSQTPPSKTILVVEDDFALLETTGRFLENLGYRVIRAPNGLCAIEMLTMQADEIDMVFSDVVMTKEMSGLELAEWVSAEYKHIKILLTSGYPDISNKTSRQPKFELLSKPYLGEPLAKAIRERFDVSDQA